MDDFIPNAPTLYNYFYEEQTAIKDSFFYETQQQEPVLRQLLLAKHYKNFPQPLH